MPLNVILHFLVYNGPKIGLKKLFIQYHGYGFVTLDRNDSNSSDCIGIVCMKQIT